MGIQKSSKPNHQGYNTYHKLLATCAISLLSAVPCWAHARIPSYWRCAKAIRPTKPFFLASPKNPASLLFPLKNIANRNESFLMIPDMF